MEEDELGADPETTKELNRTTPAPSDKNLSILVAEHTNMNVFEHTNE